MREYARNVIERTVFLNFRSEDFIQSADIVSTTSGDSRTCCRCGQPINSYNYGYRIHGTSNFYCAPCGYNILYNRGIVPNTAPEGLRRLPNIEFGRGRGGRIIEVISSSDYMSEMESERNNNPQISTTLTHSNPQLKFFGDALWVGLELEVEFPSVVDRDTFIIEFKDNSFLSEYGWLKSDSSLSYLGVEICSHPISWELWNNGDGDKFLSDLINLVQKFGGKGLDQNKSSAGLHISFDNSWFKWGDVQRIYEFCYGDENYGNFFLLSQRDSRDSLNTYAHPKPYAELDETLNAIQRGSCTRYSILNTNNQNRKEFRLFNSVVNKGFILAGMKFLQGMLSYVRKFHEHRDFLKWDNMRNILINEGYGDIFLREDILDEE
jgi:hypothetical protein